MSFASYIMHRMVSTFFPFFTQYSFCHVYIMSEKKDFISKHVGVNVICFCRDWKNYKKSKCRKRNLVERLTQDKKSNIIMYWNTFRLLGLSYDLRWYWGLLKTHTERAFGMDYTFLLHRLNGMDINFCCICIMPVKKSNS